MDEQEPETALIAPQTDLQVALRRAVSLWTSTTTSKSECREDLLRDKQRIVRAGMTALDVTHAHGRPSTKTRSTGCG